MKLLLALTLLLFKTLLVYSGPIQDGVYYIINRAFLQVIEISDWLESDGAAIGFDSISEGDNQKFQLTSVGDFYKITSLYSGKVLTAPSYTAIDTSQITQSDDTGEDLQQWNIFAMDTSGFYVIQSRNSGKVLTAEQDYVYLPLESTTGTAVGEDVATASDTSTPTDAPVSQSADAQADAQMLFPSPWYSTRNKIVQSTITAGNNYQDFLFVQIAGYDPVLESLAAPEPTDPIHVSHDPIPLSSEIEGGLDDFPALEQETVQVENGFPGNDDTVVDEPVDEEAVAIGKPDEEEAIAVEPVEEEIIAVDEPIDQETVAVDEVAGEQ